MYADIDTTHRTTIPQPIAYEIAHIALPERQRQVGPQGVIGIRTDDASGIGRDPARHVQRNDRPKIVFLVAGRQIPRFVVVGKRIEMSVRL